mgnify:CR=1 FL=1
MKELKTLGRQTEEEVQEDLELHKEEVEATQQTRQEVVQLHLLSKT